MQNYQNYKNWS